MNDLFSFGIIIYEIKTGQIAYAGRNNGEIRKSFESRSFPELAFLFSEWRVVVSKCWQKQYNNVEKNLADLNYLSNLNRRKLVISSRSDLLLYYFIRLSVAAVIIVVL
jgi:hypothetical protein